MTSVDLFNPHPTSLYNLKVQLTKSAEEATEKKTKTKKHCSVSQLTCLFIWCEIETSLNMLYLSVNSVSFIIFHYQSDWQPILKSTIKNVNLFFKTHQWIWNLLHASKVVWEEWTC